METGAQAGERPRRMSVRREFKRPCERLDEAREALARSGAQFEARCRQTDYVYEVVSSAGRRRRAKLRHEHPDLWRLYVYEPSESADVDFDLFEGLGPRTKSVLDGILELIVTVEKRRELWRDGNIVFNLDDVEGRGMIVEVEVEGELTEQEAQKLHRYRSLLARLCSGADLDSNAVISATTPAR